MAIVISIACSLSDPTGVAYPVAAQHSASLEATREYERRLADLPNSPLWLGENAVIERS
jgi:hypothetical protein